MYISAKLLALLALWSQTQLCLATETVTFSRREKGVKYIEKQFVIQYANTTEGNNAKKSITHNPDKGIVLVNEIPNLDIQVVTFSSNESAEKWRMDANGGVKSFEQDSWTYMDTQSTTDHQNRHLAETTPYGITYVKALEVSDDNAGNRKVCIIDSGYDMGHPDLPNDPNLFTGESFVSGSNWDTDENSHGTHVAGTIVALQDNGVGVVGVIRNGRTRLHISKVFPASGGVPTSTIINGFQSCVENGANVINMSLGGGGYLSSFANAIADADDDGILTFASSGNTYGSGFQYPASYPFVTAVASITEDYQRSSFSTYNNKVDVCAPGSNVLSTVPGGGYSSYSGTSMACPHAVGVAALVWSHYPTLTNHVLRDILEDTADDLGPSDYDVEYGHGLVDAEAAFNAATAIFVPTVSPRPSEAPSTSRPTEAPSTSAPTVSLSPTGAVLQFNDISAKLVALNGNEGRSISLDKGSGDVNVELTAQITGRCGDGCPSCIKAVKLVLLNPAGERVKDKCHAEHIGSSCDFEDFYDIYSIDTNLVGQWQVNVEGRWARCSDGLDNYGAIAFINVEDNSVPTVSPLQCDDSTSNFAVSGGTLGCPFVSRDIEQYCAVSIPYNVKSHCPETCSACAEYGCEDSEAEFTFEFPSGVAVIMTCSMIPGDKLTTACELSTIRSTCRKTCEFCEA